MARSSRAQPVSMDKLIKDLQVVIADAEELLRATAGQAGEKVQAARERAEESIATARERLSSLGESAVEQARELASRGDDYAHEYPWRVVGVVAGAALLIGLLVSFNRR